MLEKGQKKLYYIDKLTNNRYLFKIAENKYTNTCSDYNFNLSSLPHFIEGHILTNTNGYNPAGWWSNIRVNKYDLILE